MHKIFNKFHLQIIAAVVMTLDHLTWAIFPGYSLHPLAIILHVLGRIAFPIFAYFIAEGYHYTSNKKKYLLRIFLFALISHAPYMLCSISFKEYGWLSLIPFATGNGVTRFLNQGSVLITYFIGLLMLVVNDSNKLKTVVKAILILLFAVIAIPWDWSSVGALIVLAIGSNRGKPLKQLLFSLIWISVYVLIYSLSLDLIYGFIQFSTLLAVPLIYFYNGKKCKNRKINQVLRYFFYFYYPLHLLIIGVVSLCLNNK